MGVGFTGFILVESWWLPFGIFFVPPKSLANLWMPPAANPPPNQPPPLPAAARTTLTLVAGQPATGVEDAFTLPRDSPVVTSWSFLHWTHDAANNTAAIPRSEVVAAILAGTRRPLPNEAVNLQRLSFIEHELDVASASIWLRQYDSASAFNATYGCTGASKIGSKSSYRSKSRFMHPLNCAWRRMRLR